MTIAVAVSGGADSLYALASLCRQNESADRIVALHARFRETPPDADPVPALEERCRGLGLELHVLDLRQRFAELVMRPFAESYARGETPNPCVRCNALVKFGLLLEEARALGADRLATGHYVALVNHPRYGLTLRCGADPAKDQSYFLALTPLERLRHALFPLGEISKTAVRQHLEDWGLPVPLPQESQEICFVPDDDYRTFLKSTGIRLPAGGPMVLVDGRVVGRHGGLWQYTEGQRRGLGVSWAEPLYVTGKDRARNALLLGTSAELPVNGCVAGELNILVPPEHWPNELYVRTRYRQKAVPADVYLVGTDGKPSASRMLIRFHTQQLPSAPGQLAAVFDASGHVLAGGIIRKDY